MTYQEAFEQADYIKRENWQGKFLHDNRGELTVSDYPGSSYEPIKEDLKATDWVVFDFGGSSAVV